MIARLRSLGDGDADARAARVEGCAERRAKCGDRFCPSCAVRQAKHRRRAIERWLRGVPDDARIGMLTLTVACDDLAQGLELLRAGLTQLRRLACFATVIEGTGTIFAEAASSGGVRWLAHLHVLCRVDAASRVLTGAQRPAWAAIVGAEGLAGSLHWRTIPLAGRFASGRRNFRGQRLLRHAPRERAVAVAGRRRVAGARHRAARPTHDHRLWKERTS